MTRPRGESRNTHYKLCSLVEPLASLRLQEDELEEGRWGILHGVAGLRAAAETETKPAFRRRGCEKWGCGLRLDWLHWTSASLNVKSHEHSGRGVWVRDLSKHWAQWLENKLEKCSVKGDCRIATYQTSQVFPEQRCINWTGCLRRWWSPHPWRGSKNV